MANDAFASGHILARNLEDRNRLIQKVNTLPDKPYQGNFSIWKGLFHFPEEPSRAGYISTFGLSFKYFGEPDEIGSFLDFWESFIEDLSVDELFLNVWQEFMATYHLFGRAYFLWLRECYPKQREKRWVFQGCQPVDTSWRSRFEVAEDVQLTLNK